MIDRKEIIEQMRKERKTYKEIGKILGITHQRVHQIYKDYIMPSGIADELAYSVIRARDKNYCVICDSRKNIEIHHINGIKRDNNLDNLVSLCRKCHHKVEKQDRKTIKKDKQEKRFFNPREPINYEKKYKPIFCLYCNKKVILKSNWSVKNRKFCSRSCSAKHRENFKKSGLQP